MNIKLDINKLEDLDDTIEVSKKIFNPTPEEEKIYHNKKDWLKKIKNNGLLITARANNELVGFSICYSKGNKLHIWIVGVLEKNRRFGIWKQMHQSISNYAQKNDLKHLTLNTYESRFPGMYNFCLKNGFKEYKVEKGKSFFIKNI